MEGGEGGGESLHTREGGEGGGTHYTVGEGGGWREGRVVRSGPGYVKSCQARSCQVRFCQVRSRISRDSDYMCDECGM